MPIWRMLFTQDTPRADSFPWPSAGSNRPARIAMMAITTSSSISVNALLRPGRRLAVPLDSRFRMVNAVVLARLRRLLLFTFLHLRVFILAFPFVCGRFPFDRRSRFSGGLVGCGLHLFPDCGGLLLLR